MSNPRPDPSHVGRAPGPHTQPLPPSPLPHLQAVLLDEASSPPHSPPSAAAALAHPASPGSPGQRAHSHTGLHARTGHTGHTGHTGPHARTSSQAPKKGQGPGHELRPEEAEESRCLSVLDPSTLTGLSDLLDSDYDLAGWQQRHSSAGQLRLRPQPLQPQQAGLSPRAPGSGSSGGGGGVRGVRARSSSTGDLAAVAGQSPRSRTAAVALQDLGLLDLDLDPHPTCLAPWGAAQLLAAPARASSQADPGAGVQPATLATEAGGSSMSVPGSSSTSVPGGSSTVMPGGSSMSVPGGSSGPPHPFPAPPAMSAVAWPPPSLGGEPLLCYLSYLLLWLADFSIFSAVLPASMMLYALLAQPGKRPYWKVGKV